MDSAKTQYGAKSPDLAAMGEILLKVSWRENFNIITQSFPLHSFGPKISPGLSQLRVSRLLSHLYHWMSLSRL